MSKSSAPLVTVVVTAYNSEAFLGRCLETIAAQTLRNIEVIVVDDGSIDGTGALADAFAARDSRFMVLHEPNEGDGASKNKGILLAKGEYLSFLDSDDEFDPDMLEKAYACAVERDADIVFFGCRTKNVETGAVREGVGMAPECAEGINYAGSERLFSLSNPAPWTKLFRRAFVREQKLYFDRIPNCEDVAFGWCAFAAARSIFCLRHDFVTYQLTGKNVSVSGYADASCILDAGRSVLSFLCRTGRTWLLDEFFGALVKCIVYEYSVFPGTADCMPYLKDVFSFLPGKMHGVCWNSLKQFAAEHPSSAPFDSRAMLEAERPLATVVMHVEGSKGLDAGMRSILYQTAKDFELLCIVCGQDEEAWRTVLGFAKKDRRILACRLPGGDARQIAGLGTKLARGRFVLLFEPGAVYHGRTALQEILGQASAMQEGSRPLLLQRQEPKA